MPNVPIMKDNVLLAFVDVLGQHPLLLLRTRVVAEMQDVLHILSVCVPREKRKQPETEEELWGHRKL